MLRPRASPRWLAPDHGIDPDHRYGEAGWRSKLLPLELESEWKRLVVDYPAHLPAHLLEAVFLVVLGRATT